MAVSSGFYYVTWSGIAANTLALDVTLDTYKGALFTDTLVPAFSTATVYGTAPYDANETSGGSWPAGGIALAGTVLSTEAGGLMVLDATNVSQVTTDITAAMGYFWYATTPFELLVGIDFVSAATTVNGTFEIQWTAAASGGVWNFDLEP